MDHPYNSVVLKRLPANENHPPYFMWTKKGNAQTLTHRRELEETKDQCLFLRGFLLDASPEAWKAGRDSIKLREANQKRKDFQMSEQQPNKGARDTSIAPGGSSGTGQEAMGTGNSLLFNPSWHIPSAPVLSDITIHPIPSSETLASAYPSHRLNKSLLTVVSQAAPLPANLTLRIEINIPID
jgi:hypothetical protein